MYKDPNFEYYVAYQVQIRSRINGGPCGDEWECYGKCVEDKAEAKRLQAKARRETGYKTRCFAFETCREKQI